MSDLSTLVQATQAPQPSDAQLAPLVAGIETRFGDNLAAILFYGSCRSTPAVTEGLIDLLVLVDDYDKAHTSALAARLNGWLPPNVYFFEAEGLQCKYAVISMAQFRSKMHSRIDHYFWARFAQPFTPIHTRSDDIKKSLVANQVQALKTFYTNLVAIEGTPADSQRFWSAGLQKTYACDLRPESPAHSQTVIARAPEFWGNVTDALQQECPESHINTSPRRIDWRIRRVVGKALNLARLIKAAGTFSNGIDYLAWKVERHSGVKVETSPWMRRHPRLGGLRLAFGLWRQGGFR